LNISVSVSVNVILQYFYFFNNSNLLQINFSGQNSEVTDSISQNINRLHFYFKSPLTLKSLIYSLMPISTFRTWCRECYFRTSCGDVHVYFRSIGAAGWCLRSRPVKDLVDWKNTLMRNQPTSEPVLRYTSHCNSS